MIKAIVLVPLSLLLCSPVLGGTNLERWRIAHTHFVNSKKLPQEVHIISRAIDDEGNLLESSKLYCSLHRTKSNRLYLVVESGFSDGKKLTASECAEMSEEVNEEELQPPFPFDLTDPGSIIHNPSPLPETAGAETCPSAFSATIDKHPVTGVITYDCQTSLPLEVNWTITEPFEEDSLAVSSLNQHDTYQITSGGNCLQAVSKTVIEAEYGILFLQKRITIITEETYLKYVDYTKLPLYVPSARNNGL